MQKLNIRVILIIILFPLLSIAQIQDAHIQSTVEKYFARNRTAPALMSASVVDDIMYGRTLKISIRGHRNSENEDIGFAFGAAASIASRASSPIETLWVEMGVRYKRIETTIAIAPAKCSSDAIVRKTRSFASWWEECLEFL
jgi:hypothetical protein